MSDTLCIITNNVPRNLIYGYELTAKEKADFDYIDAEDVGTHEFFRYKGRVYDPSEFTPILASDREEIDHPAYTKVDTKHPFAKWHGFMSQGFFFGIVIRYTSDMEQVIVGTYVS